MPRTVRPALGPALAIVAAGLALAVCFPAVTPGSAVAVRAATVPAAEATTVIAVSVDGLNPAALRKLGADRAPTLHRLIREGASTLDARTARERTTTLPNHTSMVTGRRITAASGGHGVTWNDGRLRPRTVQRAAGHPVASVFGVVDTRERDTALFASKRKFSLFERSWDDAIDRFVVRRDNAVLTRKVRRDIVGTERSFRFVHYSWPDTQGHAHGFLSRAYLRAVADVDRWLGRVVASVEGQDSLAGHVTVVVTSDHGGRRGGHSDPTRRSSYRVPFIVWGAGVEPGADLYDLNPDYADPGRRRTTYAADEQPVRNGALANLVTDLLGLRVVPGSEHDADHDLDVR